MRELYIVRHGETELNRINTIQGKGENPPLNETGLIQAEKFYSRYRHIKFDYVFTSSLIRTHQTVAKFISNNIPWIATDKIDEICWGDLEGKPTSHVVRERFHSLINEWNNGNLNSKIENGESPLEIQIKHKEFVGELLTLPGDNILVCSHGRAMRILLSTLLDTPLTKMDQYHHRNTSLYRLSYDGKKFTLLEQNNLDHLND
jgi:broad specificity phosphatase PhoE